MTSIVYLIVEHDGGWAYRLNDVYSETFDSKEQASAAAHDAAARHELPGPSETIQYQDEDGNWHEETTSGLDRPEVRVEEAPGEPGAAEEGAGEGAAGIGRG